MSSPHTFYLTTTLPYVNAEPHIGFALEIVAADAICRFHRDLLHEDVTFNTGTDEHGQKIYQNALDRGVEPQAYVDEYAAKFDDLKQLLNLSYDRFIRTTNAAHKLAAQEFWRRCAANVDEQGQSDIYKKVYKVKYCVGCELEKTDSELVDGKCPLHPNRDLEIREEENYFFRFSRYQQQLLDLYALSLTASDPFVEPESKMKEIVAFVEGGLQDFSISRLKAKMPWGVPAPDDDDHVMYVWFDALINYISTIGWPHDLATYSKYWPGVQIAGKDNLRQQSAMWQAMLASAGLEYSRKILINGFISVNGQKMSKSLGNVISPTELVDRYSIDGARFILMHIGPIDDDMDVSWEKLDAIYTAHLANGLGNLCSRVAKLCEKANYSYQYPLPPPDSTVVELYQSYQLKAVVANLTTTVSNLDQFLSDRKPWTLDGNERNQILTELVRSILSLAIVLQPLMPTTAQQILTHFQAPTIAAITPLFPRLPS